MRRWLKIMTGILISLSGFTQADQGSTRDIDHCIEFLLNDGMIDSEDVQSITDLFHRHLQYPIDMNEIDNAALKGLPFIQELELELIRAHHFKFGGFKSVYEIQGVLDLNPLVMALFIRMITVERPSEISCAEALQTPPKVEFVARVQRLFTTNNQDNRYSGNLMRSFGRVALDWQGKLGFAILTEKDAGEALIQQSLPTKVDHLSMHAFYKGSGRISKLVLGDYKVQFGQGLVIWQGWSGGKSSMVMHLKKNANGFVPNRSSDEVRFMRGVAAEVKMGRCTWTPFLSRKMIDARVEEGMEGKTIATIYETGYHRTSSEISNRSTVSEWTGGLGVLYHRHSTAIGIHGYGRQLEYPTVQKAYSFGASEKLTSTLTSLGLSYSTTIQGVHLFGETAWMNAEHLATLNTLLVPVSKRISFSMLHRYYSVGFRNPLANAFRAGTYNTNETGIFFGLKYEHTKKWSLETYLDLFHSSGPTINALGIDRRKDVLLKLSYVHHKSEGLSIRWRKQYKSVPEMFDIVNISSTQLRLSGTLFIHPNVESRIRIDLNYLDSTSNKSTHLNLEFIAKLPGSAWSISAGVSYFDGSGAGNIYRYERNFSGVYSNLTLSGIGSRVYFLVRYKMKKNMSLWFKVGITDKMNSAIPIVSQRDTDVGLQFQYSF